MFEPEDRTIHNSYATIIMVGIGVGVVHVFSAVYRGFVLLERMVRQVTILYRRVGFSEAARKK